MMMEWLRVQWQARRLAVRRRLALLLRGEFDPYPIPPEGLKLSPSEWHHVEVDAAPLALSWSRAGIDDPGEWQRVARDRLRTLVGFSRDNDVPVAKHVDDQPVAEGFQRRRQYLRVAAGSDVPVNLVWREGAGTEPMPVMICLQGTNAGAHLSWGQVLMPADPIKIDRGADIALQAARRGYLSVCVEQACFGERREQILPRRSPTPCIDTANHAIALGRCLVGERAGDVSATLDWLLGGEHGLSIDVARVHVMGSSSGGTTALYSAALDERITAVLASSCLGFVRDTMRMRGDPEGQNLIPGMLLWFELDDIVALCAPRPFVTVSARDDHIWPYDGAATVVESAKKAYAALNALDAIVAVPAEGGHRFYPKIAWPAFEKLVALQ
mgnify:CR=1 FL=1